MIGWIAGLLALDMPAAHTPMLTHTTPRTVFVHLFEWTWPDIARECENYLGPQGFAAVQVSPPNEHALIQQSDGNYPWWQRYQPVSYRIDQSRSGTRSEFEDMVTRCRKVGVDIYVDTVINHMTGGNGTGFDGTYFYGSNNSPIPNIITPVSTLITTSAVVATTLPPITMPGKCKLVNWSGWLILILAANMCVPQSPTT